MNEQQECESRVDLQIVPFHCISLCFLLVYSSSISHCPLSSVDFVEKKNKTQIFKERNDDDDIVSGADCLRRSLFILLILFLCRSFSLFASLTRPNSFTLCHLWRSAIFVETDRHIWPIVQPQSHPKTTKKLESLPVSVLDHSRIICEEKK